jgi:hypothetical protein
VLFVSHHLSLMTILHGELSRTWMSFAEATRMPGSLAQNCTNRGLSPSQVEKCSCL